MVNNLLRMGVLLKPPTAVRNPPAKHKQRQSERETPPERQGNVHGQAEDDEEHPEDLFFHKTEKTLPRINTDNTDQSETQNLETQRNGGRQGPCYVRDSEKAKNLPRISTDDTDRNKLN